MNNTKPLDTGPLVSEPLYVFSGLGADERVFQKLDFSGYSVTFIRWIPPVSTESIEQYASRISAHITSPQPILIGLSFGGMMAVEVAKQIQTSTVVLIASAKVQSEIPFYFRWIGKLRLHKLIPVSWMKRANALSYWFFGAESESEKQLLKQILDDTDPDFLKWAIDKIVRWKNSERLENVMHIHGTLDRILPYRFVKADFSIEGGGHFMTLNKPEEVMTVIRNYTESSSES